MEENGIAKRKPVRTAQLDAERVVVLEGLSQGTEVLSGPGLRTLVGDDPVVVPTPGEPVAAVGTDEPA